MFDRPFLSAPDAGGPDAAIPVETIPIVSEPVETAPALSASPSPAASPSPSVSPSPAAEPTVPVLAPEVSPAATVEVTEVPATDAPEGGDASGGLCGWLIAGAALLAALIVAAIFLALRRKGRAASPASVLGFDVGKVHEQGARESQQDCFAVSPDELRGEYGLLAVVADGMGGLTDGDKVSQAAVGAMLDGFCAAPGDGQLALLELLQKANLAVNRLLGAENLSKSGSTLAAALIRGGRFHWLSVGDSRIALLRGGALIQLNREHIYKNELLLSAVNGQESFASALSRPKAAGLTSYLGMGRLKHVDIPAAPVEVLPGDVFVLMSDGVYNALDERELISALSRPAHSAADEIKRAVTAKGYRTQDNFTAVIIEAVPGGKRGGT